MARFSRGGKADRMRMQHREHTFSGKGETCDDCGLSKRNSVHGNMTEIAERIAEREDREYHERRPPPREIQKEYRRKLDEDTERMGKEMQAKRDARKD